MSNGSNIKTSTNNLFNNFTKIIHYKGLNVKSKLNPELDSEIVIIQNFKNALPENFKNKDNWLEIAKNIPEDANEDKLDEFNPPQTLKDLDNDIFLNNIYDTFDGKYILAVIHGNIEWNGIFKNRQKIKIKLSNLPLGLSDNEIIFEYRKREIVEYYFYILNDEKIYIDESDIKNITVDTAVLDNNDNIIQDTNIKIETINIDNFKKVDLTEDYYIYDHHKNDFKIYPPMRNINFTSMELMGIPEALKNKTSTLVSIGENSNIKSYSDKSGWNIYSTIVKEDNKDYEYLIYGWYVDDIKDPYELKQKFLVLDEVGDINCVAAIDKKIVQGQRIKINKNDRRDWQHANTTNKDQTGTYGKIIYDLPNAKNGSVALVTVTIFTHSNNQKMTKGGINGVYYTETLKGDDAKTVIVKVPVNNKKVVVEGIWYLKYGSYHPKHSEYKNWHRGYGYFHIKSIEYEMG